MYDLNHATVLAYQKLSSLLKTGGYQPIIGSLGMWTYELRNPPFCLCVDDFVIEYYAKIDIHRLHDTIATKYT